MSIIKPLQHLTTILLCCLMPFAASSETMTESDPRVTESRAAVKAFGKELITQLKQALEEGGPIKAIKVCNSEAPEIATKLSSQYDWEIGRTSLKTRNPKNNPDEWETKVLQQFEQRKQQGEAIAKLEYYETTAKGFRYMKAIPTKGLCLTCHGDAIPESVKTTLVELYPEDKATGFKAGQIRGAFTVFQNK
jgi:Protein of unknown function (DUF3365)